MEYLLIFLSVVTCGLLLLALHILMENSWLATMTIALCDIGAWILIGWVLRFYIHNGWVIKTRREDMWDPDWCIHPGEALEEYITCNYTTNEEFAEKANMSLVMLKALIMGRADVDAVIANKLEKGTGVRAHIWLDMQDKYDRHVVERDNRSLRSKKIAVLISIIGVVIMFATLCIMIILDKGGLMITTMAVGTTASIVLSIVALDRYMEGP